MNFALSTVLRQSVAFLMQADAFNKAADTLVSRDDAKFIVVNCDPLPKAVATLFWL